MKTYIEERAVEVAKFMIHTNATVRETAKKFGISKSTVHMGVMIQNGLYGRYNKRPYRQTGGIDQRRKRAGLCRLVVFWRDGGAAAAMQAVPASRQNEGFQRAPLWHTTFGTKV